jgi:hypothetical protein
MRRPSFILVREVPYCSRFTHQASGAGGGFAFRLGLLFTSR